MKLKVRKIRFNLLALFTLLLNFGWAQEPENFYFKEAQPRKEEEQIRFASTIRGLYKHDKDSTKRLRITGDTLAIEIPMVQFATINQLEQKKYSFQDSVVVTPSGKTLPAMQKNDTVFFIDFAQSVLFARSDKQIIKRIDDLYVLNKEVEENKWECLLLYKDNDKICLAYFDFDNKKEEVKKNKKIEKILNNSSSYYLANMKKKDFIKLVDTDYFPIKNFYYKRFDWQ